MRGAGTPISRRDLPRYGAGALTTTVVGSSVLVGSAPRAAAGIAGYDLVLTPRATGTHTVTYELRHWPTGALAGTATAHVLVS